MAINRHNSQVLEKASIMIMFVMDLTDFEWEDIYSEFGTFYIKRS